MAEKNSEQKPAVKDTAPEKATFNVDGKDFSDDELRSMIVENNNLSKFKGKEEALALGDNIQELSKTPEGVEQIEAMFQKAKVDAGWKPEESFDFSIKSDNPETQKLAEGLGKVYEMMQEAQKANRQTKADMANILQDFGKDFALDKTAQTSIEKVKSELGLDVSASEIRQAMKDNNIDDPVNAILLSRRDDVLKQQRETTKEKPNFARDSSVREVDLDNMSSVEIMQYAKDYPEQMQEKISEQQKK